MIDLKLLNLIDAKMPKMNPKIIDNIVVSQMAGVEELIHDTFRCAAESFPPGLKYVGGKRCTPLEQFREITRPLKPTKGFEMLQSDVYLMKYIFTFNGVELRPNYIFLPFVSDGGLLHLKGTLYKLTPVISGKVFNIERGGIYMPTPRIRMGFSQTGIASIKNNKIIHTDCIYSYLHNVKKTERSPLYPTLIHYILAEYGLTGMMSKIFNVSIKVGEQELDSLSQEEWVVYRSRQIPPVTRKAGDNAISEIRIAVPVEQYTLLLDSIISTVFYIIDNCVENTKNIEDLDNPQLWMRLLYRFIFKAALTEKKQYEKIEDHLHSTKRNMDPITKRILASDGIFCNTIFDLFKYICLHYQDIKIHHDIGTMYYKELSIVKHIMFHVVYNIFRVMWELEKLPVNLLKIEKINSIMMTTLRKDKIFTTKGHGELTPVSIATDCKPFSATCNMISYSKATVVGGSKRNKKVINDPSLLLHESQAEVGSYLWITNHGPEGRSKTNPFLHFTEHSYITPRPELNIEILELRELLEKHR